MSVVLLYNKCAVHDTEIIKRKFAETNLKRSENFSQEDGEAWVCLGGP
jgi:hypothetical protein